MEVIRLKPMRDYVPHLRAQERDEGGAKFPQHLGFKHVGQHFKL